MWFLKGECLVDKEVIIMVRGTQTDADNEPNVVELVTEGRYYKQDNAYFVTYNESEVTGMEGTTTTLKVDDGIVTLMRSGSVNSHFVFQRGQRHMSHYDTEFGAFTISVYAEDVDVRINDKGGEIRVGYQMEIDNNRTGMNDFHMFIREAGNADDKYIRAYKAADKKYC
jgi:uncharacterized beta-barrel protein YwiB (DUF1934 family)